MIIQNIAYYNRVLQTTLNADFFFLIQEIDSYKRNTMQLFKMI